MTNARQTSFLLVLATGMSLAWAAPGMTEGEIRKVDKDSGKLTIKHGEIKNLDMPAMTMVFHVKDRAMLDKLQAGSKVRFKAAQEAGKFMVTEIETAP